MPDSSSPHGVTPAADKPTVVTAIVTSERGVLLCRRNDEAPLWTFPGGNQEPGESHVETCVRECAEETGLEVAPGVVLGERVHPRSGRFMVYIACTVISGEARVGDPDEHAEVRWFTWAEAEPLLPQLYEPVAEHLRATIG